MTDDSDVVGELFPEFRDISDIINPLVEAPGELGRDSLNRNTAVRNGGEDNEQFGRRLRRIRLVHRDFCYKVAPSFCMLDCGIDGRGASNRFQVLARRGSQKLFRNFECADSLDGDLTGEFRMFVYE